MTEQFANDNLRALWEEQPTELCVPNMKELTLRLHEEHRQEQRRLLFLNLREVTPAGALAGWFGWNGWHTTSNAGAFFGAALLSFGVGAFLIASSLRQRRLERGFGRTIREELERSRSQMQHRSRLYRTVGWWYLLPLTAAIVLAMVAGGADFAATATVVYLFIVVGADIVLYRLNRKIGRECYEPKVKRLTQLIADME